MKLSHRARLTGRAHRSEAVETAKLLRFEAVKRRDPVQEPLHAC